MGTETTKLLIGSILQAQELEDGTLGIDLRPKHGVLVDSKGAITQVGPLDDFRDTTAERIDYGDSYLVPGFIDTHVHYPQIDLIGAYSGALIEWLDEHTFPHEMKIIQDNDRAKDAAERFCRELYKQGTTCAVAFASSKEGPTQELFQAFARSGGRLISGKISMDQHAPLPMLDPLEKDKAATERLIEQWHGFEDRIHYALSPRFVPSCSEPMLKEIGEHFQRDKTLYLQTHYAENLDEITWVRKLYPKAKDYLDVYDSFGMLDHRTILAHGIHSSPDEKRRLAEKSVVMSHCPTSNLFLGSGLFAWKDHCRYHVPLTLGSDVGAGTSFSIWTTMAEGIKISKLRHQQVAPEAFLYAASKGAAKALGLKSIGAIEAGYDCDVQVLDPKRRELLENRLKYCDDPQQVLSALIFLSNENTQVATWVKGKEVWKGED